MVRHSDPRADQENQIQHSDTEVQGQDIDGGERDRGPAVTDCAGVEEGQPKDGGAEERYYTDRGKGAVSYYAVD